MAKRFTDSELWDKEWFMKLSCKHKCLVKMIRDKCDLSGVWSPNLIIASAYIGESVTLKEILEIDNGNQFAKIAAGKIFCIGFIKFQYGELSEKSPVHRKILNLLKSHGIENTYNQIGYQYPINRVQEEEEEKDKEEDKDKEKEKEEGVKLKKKKETKDHLFEDSPFMDFVLFEKEFEGTDYEFCDLRIYHEKVKNWSASKGAKKKDWIATTRNFIISDKESGKLILKQGSHVNGTNQDQSDFGAAINERFAKRYGNKSPTA
jgi:hypothetical protein